MLGVSSSLLTSDSIHPDTSFSTEVRKQLRIHGLSPPNVETYSLQTQRCKLVICKQAFGALLILPGLKQLMSKTTPIEKYIYLSNLRNTNPHLFFRVVLENFTVSLHGI